MNGTGGRTTRPSAHDRAGRKTLTHPWIVGIVAGVVFVAAWAVAARRPPPPVELDVNRWLNDAPGWVARLLWTPMQLGGLWAPLVIALVVGVWRRNWRFTACLAAAELFLWPTVRALKHIADRGRPAAFVEDVVVRDGWARGLGFPSGHAATAAMTAVVCMAVVPRRYRWLLVAIAATVGIARVVHGVHLPVDLVGGWAYGVLVGLATLAIYDLRPRGVRPSSSSQPVTS